MRKTARTLLVATLLVAGFTLAPPAQAGSGTGGATAGSAGVVSRKVRSCRLYASESSFGMLCRRYSGTGRSIEEILDGEELPHCWDEPLPAELADEYAPLQSEREALGERGRYVLRTCLSGIDPETLEVTGEIEFSQEPTWVPEGDPGLPDLGPNQRLLVAIERRSASIPLPLLVATPTVRPRVGQNVSFAVANARSVGPLAYQRATGTVQMRARLAELKVTPAAGLRSVSCPGGGVEVTPADTPLSRPGACWWRYERSSAAQPGGTYPVEASAHWVVEYSTGGGQWRQLAEFDKQQTLMQQVTEVQTVVVR